MRIGSTGMLLMALAWMSPTYAACPPAGYDTASLQALRTQAFELPDAKARAALAVSLADRLGDPDPKLRDGIAYEAQSTWMHKDQLAPQTLRALRDRLVPMLGAEDPDGFRTIAFLTALYTIAQENDDATARTHLLPGLRSALRQVP